MARTVLSQILPFSVKWLACEFNHVAGSRLPNPFCPDLGLPTPVGLLIFFFAYFSTIPG